MEPRFHFFTLLTKNEQYARMRESLTAAGFDEVSIYTALDNREGNVHEPYSAITEAVRTAQAPYVVFCHQDLLFGEGPNALLTRIEELNTLDPRWAIIGNTGYTPRFDLAVCLDDPTGSQLSDNLPARVVTLDENLLVIRRDAGVGCSPEMSGFHLYATDLCLNAYMRGRSAYVVEFRVDHLTGALDYTGLHDLAGRFRRVWRRRIRGALLMTPSMVLLFSRVPLLFHAANRPGLYARLAKRYRLMSTFDFLLRGGRPVWLPMGWFDARTWHGPSLNPALRTLDAVLSLGRPHDSHREENKREPEGEERSR